MKLGSFHAHICMLDQENKRWCSCERSFIGIFLPTNIIHKIIVINCASHSLFAVAWVVMGRCWQVVFFLFFMLPTTFCYSSIFILPKRIRKPFENRSFVKSQEKNRFLFLVVYPKIGMRGIHWMWIRYWVWIRNHQPNCANEMNLSLLLWIHLNRGVR